MDILLIKEHHMELGFKVEWDRKWVKWFLRPSLHLKLWNWTIVLGPRGLVPTRNRPGVKPKLKPALTDISELRP